MIRVEGPDETAGPLAVIPGDCRDPAAGARYPAPIALHQVPGGIGRVFIPADTGRGLQIEIVDTQARRTGSPRVTARTGRHAVPRRPRRLPPDSDGAALAMFDVDAADVVAGIL